MTVIQMTRRPMVNKKNRKSLDMIVECQIKYTKFTNETNYKVLEQITKWVGEQKDFFIKQLKTLSSIFEIYDIVTVGYDEKSIDSVMQGIMKGELEPTKWNTFVMDRNLNEQGWPVYKVIKQDGETKVEICK